jgi:hypothetical protein
VTTTFEAIRDNQARLIEAIVPTQKAGERFKRHREGEFMAWVAANPKACFRRFQILANFDLEQMPTADGSIDQCRHTFEIRVAYPLTMGKYGAENERDMDDLMVADLHKIDTAIGLHGGPNYVAGQHLCEKRDQAPVEVEGARLISVTYLVQYDRSV